MPAANAGSYKQKYMGRTIGHLGFYYLTNAPMQSSTLNTKNNISLWPNAGKTFTSSLPLQPSSIQGALALEIKLSSAALHWSSFLYGYLSKSKKKN